MLLPLSVNVQSMNLICLDLEKNIKLRLGRPCCILYYFWLRLRETIQRFSLYVEEQKINKLTKYQSQE